MISKIVKKLCSLTMKSQIILFNVITLMIVLLVVWINYYVQTEIFSQISFSSLNHILQEQDKHRIGFIAQNIAITIELKFMSILSQMEQIKRFYIFFEQEKGNILNNQKQDPCISIKDFIKDNTTFYTPKFCYQAIGVPDYITIPQNETGVFILDDFISFLNHYNQLLDVSYSGMIQISSISQTNYFSQFPFCFLLPWFNITTLAWYKNHLLKSSEDQRDGFIFSPLNDYFITKIKEMSITSSLYHDGQMIGIIREGLIINEYLIPTVPYNILLLDQDGLVVYFNIEQLRNKTDYFYIYDQNVTGFNKTDWKEMIEFSNYREKEILVLKNKLQDENVNVYSLQVLKNNFTLIVYTNITTKIDQENQSSAIREASFINFTIQLLAQIFLGFAAIILSVLVLLIVFKPIKQFNSIIKQYTLSQGNNVNSEIFKMIHQKSQKSDALTNLQNKILNFSQILSERQGKKCEMCKVWEAFTYNEKELLLDFDQVKNLFKKIENGKQEFEPNMLKIIKQGIK